jgi:hypothetical protein
MNIKQAHVQLLLIVLAVVLVYNLYAVTGINSGLNELTAESEEYNRPADIEISVIVDSACLDCFDIFEVVDGIKESNVEILTETILEFESDEAVSLIKQYGVEKLPTVIVTGEIDKEGAIISNLDEVKSALVFTDLEPVYIEVESGNYRGRTTLTTIVNEDCTDCYDISIFADALSTQLVVTKSEILNQRDGSNLIQEYGLTILPALIVQGDIEVYESVIADLGDLAKEVKDAIVLDAEISPPYYSIVDDEIKGLVTITYLLDSECDTCYDYTIHRNVLGSYGIEIVEEKFVDISIPEGEELIEKYNITKVPTIIISEDGQVYPNLMAIWEIVGTIEDDGNLVFRELDQISPEYVEL